MKYRMLIQSAGAPLLAALLAWPAPAYPQTTMETQTVTSEGTVSEFRPDADALIVRSETSPAPVRYVITKKTTFVDETGAPVAMTEVTSGAPVKVTYAREPDRSVVSKVVVRRHGGVSETRTETSAASGSIVTYTPSSSTLVLRSESSPQPVQYLFTGNTLFVDSAGNVLTAPEITPGTPVQIQYVHENGTLVASKVILSRAPVETIRRQTTTTIEGREKDVRKHEKEEREREKDEHEDHD